MWFPGDHHPSRTALKGGDVRLVERYGEQAVMEEALARRDHLSRRLRCGIIGTAPMGFV